MYQNNHPRVYHLPGPGARPSAAMNTTSQVSAQDRPALWLTVDMPLSESMTVRQTSSLANSRYATDYTRHILDYLSVSV